MPSRDVHHYSPPTGGRHAFFEGPLADGFLLLLHHLFCPEQRRVVETNVAPV